MDYSAKLDEAISRLHDEGRYRTFIDIERKNGQFPHATWRRSDGTETPITVWCGNDYLGMGQHPVVLAAMHEAIEATGAGSGGTPHSSCSQRPDVRERCASRASEAFSEISSTNLSITSYTMSIVNFTFYPLGHTGPP